MPKVEYCGSDVGDCASGVEAANDDTESGEASADRLRLRAILSE